MLEIARNAKSSLGDPNTVVTCRVDPDGEIISIAYAVTLGAVK